MREAVAKMLKVRNWLIDAATKLGGKVEGAGFGGDGADFDFTLGDRHYWVQIIEVDDEPEAEGDFLREAAVEGSA
jgi:hypothetical protein